jgi:acetyl-CoA carboxylase biotin carboxyl carrier protein
MIVPSPGVGEWDPAFREGQLVRGGDRIGVLRVLGVATAVTAPADATGIVVGGALRRGPVGYGDALYVLDPAAVIGADPARAAGAAQAATGLVFRAPTSGRFYSRSAPGKPPFVSAGDAVKPGQTVCMLEVMKTFNRVVYEGVEARVTEVVAADEADVDAGAVLLRLEPL